MNPLEKILGSQKSEHEKFSCQVCSCEFFWKSVYGGTHCWKCEPASVRAMVAESNLVEQVDERCEFGWVKCEDGQYRDYFVDDGRMWLITEEPGFVRFTLVE